MSDADPMTNNTPTASGRIPRSPAAERMRRSRQRCKKGLTCITVELRAEEIRTLIRWGDLAPDQAGDKHAIQAALYKWLDRGALGSRA